MLVDEDQTSIQFNDIVRSEQQLREIAGNASFWFSGKVLSRLDDACRRFIAKSPFVVVASSGMGGHVDASPKGDHPGFVRILDDATLAIPDRAGNRRFDTFRNLLANPHIGLIFFVPGRRETLRVGGKAMIVRDRSLREAMASKGRVPEFATVVSVARVLFHCGSCIARSNLWDQAEQEHPLAPVHEP
jgi:PPOX class probable FMN-dependent enzyme